MKISPVASSGQTAINPNEGHSAGADRVARAKAAMAGQTVEQAQTQAAQGDPQAERAQASIKRIKMRTQRSTMRYEAPPVPTEMTETAAMGIDGATEAALTPETQTPSDTLATSEQVETATEATQPLSPQFAALAKAKRALQAKEREIAAREAALQVPPDQTGSYTKDQIKANALSILRDAGVTNEQLTEAILRESQDYGPGYSKLEAELQALKESLETQNKTAAERDVAAEKQVLTQIRKDVDALIAQGDDYQLVREAGYAPKVVDLMHKVFKAEGEILDVSEAAQLIENELLEESLKFAALKKVQNRLNPPVPPAQPQPVKQAGANTKIMRTLTNRDGSSAISMGKRERAIAAMEGRLK